MRDSTSHNLWPFEVVIAVFIGGVAAVGGHMASVHAKRLKVGDAILAVGTLPLLPYVILGPKDGNPVGLGILMWLSWLVGGILVIRGTIDAVVAYFPSKRIS